MRSWSIVLGRSLVLIAAVYWSLSGATARAGGAVSEDQLESFLGLASGSLLDFGNGPIANGSALQASFTAEAGQVLSFQYTFLTDEDAMNLGNVVNDFAFMTLTSHDPMSIADVVGTTFAMGSTPFLFNSSSMTSSMTIADAGTYTLGLGVVNVTDGSFPSALLVDDFRLDSTLLDNGDFASGNLDGFMTIGNAGVVTSSYGANVPSGTYQALLSSAVPEPTSVVSLGLGVFLILVKARRRRPRV